MKEQIRANIDQPEQLETMYRQHKSEFEKAFEELYPEIKTHPNVQVWQARLQFGKQTLKPTSNKAIALVALLALIAGFTAKLPQFIGMESDVFFQRNIGLVVFPSIMIFFAWKQKLPVRYVVVNACVLVLTAIFINLLPPNNSDTLILACIHLPLLLWSFTGLAFIGGQLNHTDLKISFLRYNGDLLVMSTIIIIAGGMLTIITIGLFELIDMNIAAWYANHIAVWGLAAIPITATYLIQRNPQLVQQVSPTIARIFTPLVLIMLVAYLAAMVYTGKDPYNDREFLFIFNLLLIGVMAIILFSVAEQRKQQVLHIETVMLVALAIVTLIVNGVALSAILFRITQMGITPNRLAVLGSNALMLIHLLLVSYRLFLGLRRSAENKPVEESIVVFLPIYALWAAIVVFGFPLLFDFA
ncbi:MAG: hypothetical protein ACO3BD_00855 [Chitinophagaceae bacterium]